MKKNALPTRAFLPVENPFGEGETEQGWYISHICPVQGTTLLPHGPYKSFEEAQTSIQEIDF